MPGAQHLSQKVLAMKTAKYGDDITLNKPLLVLYALSQYKKGHGCLFDYASEVKPNLRELLKRYGPERNAQQTAHGELDDTRRRISLCVLGSSPGQALSSSANNASSV